VKPPGMKVPNATSAVKKATSPATAHPVEVTLVVEDVVATAVEAEAASATALAGRTCSATAVEGTIEYPRVTALCICHIVAVC
jgi:hypothetical protein